MNAAVNANSYDILYKNLHEPIVEEPFPFLHGFVRAGIGCRGAEA